MSVKPNREEFGRVAVLLGGNSAERDISLMSGQAVLAALMEEGVNAVAVDLANAKLESLPGRDIERVFIMLHGKTGEDGTVQGALEMLGLPYTGSGVLASALAMDKVRSKKIWAHDGLPTPGFEVLSDETNFEALLDRLGAVFVKPVREGSSLGIGQAATVAELKAAYDSAARFDAEVLAETRISGREFSVPILGDKVLPIIEMQTDNTFYDYEAKYFSDETRYICPSELDDGKRAELEQLALDAYASIGCKGWGRVDVMQDENGNFWLLEVNTVPGMTEHSLVPMSAKAMGLSFNQLVLEILRETLER